MTVCWGNTMGGEGGGARCGDAAPCLYPSPLHPSIHTVSHAYIDIHVRACAHVIFCPRPSSPILATAALQLTSDGFAAAAWPLPWELLPAQAGRCVQKSVLSAKVSVFVYGTTTTSARTKSQSSMQRHKKAPGASLI